MYNKLAKTTMILPIALLTRAKRELGTKSRTDAVVIALEEALRARRLLAATRSLAGKVKVALTQKGLRRLRADAHP